jgi:hypothetical protein
MHRNFFPPPISSTKPRIEAIVVLTLLPVAPEVPPATGCFELYGFGKTASSSSYILHHPV